MINKDENYSGISFPPQDVFHDWGLSTQHFLFLQALCGAAHKGYLNIQGLKKVHLGFTVCDTHLLWRQ